MTESIKLPDIKPKTLDLQEGLKAARKKQEFNRRVASMKASLKEHEAVNGVVASRVWNQALSNHGLTKHPSILEKAATNGHQIAWRDILGSLTFDLDTRSHKWAGPEGSLVSSRPTTSHKGYYNGARKPVRLIDPTVSPVAHATPTPPPPKTKAPASLATVKPPPTKNSRGSTGPPLNRPVSVQSLTSRPPSVKKPQRPRPTVQRNESMQRKVEMLRSQVSDALYVKHRALKDAFRTADKDKSGWIDMVEFEQMLHELNLGYEPVVLQELIAQCDKDKDNRIAYWEFARYLKRLDEQKVQVFGRQGEAFRQEQRNSAPKAYGSYAMAPSKKNAFMLDLFKSIDADNDGFLSRYELEEGLRLTRLDQALLEQGIDVNTIMRKCDANNDNHLDYEQFLKLTGTFTSLKEKGVEPQITPKEPANP